jgi:hypothetical protein
MGAGMKLFIRLIYFSLMTVFCQCGSNHDLTGSHWSYKDENDSIEWAFISKDTIRETTVCKAYEQIETNTFIFRIAGRNRFAVYEYKDCDYYKLHNDELICENLNVDMKSTRIFHRMNK